MKNRPLLFPLFLLMAGILCSCTKENENSDTTPIIQSVTVVPDYDDGNVMAVNGLLEFDCIVTPATALDGIGSDLKDNIVLYSSIVNTKSLSSEPIQIRSADIVDAGAGTIRIAAEISNALNCLGEGETLAVAVSLKNSVSTFTSGFANVTNREVTWTEDQMRTVKSLRKVDRDGYLYEINYLADYQLDKVLSMNAADLLTTIDNIKSTILPNSKYDVLVEIVNLFTQPIINLLGSSGLGCSCFTTGRTGGGYILGRNYDYPPLNDHSMIVHTPQVKDASGKVIRHATVGCADLAPLTTLLEYERGYKTDDMKEFALYSPYFILDGINDEGLTCGLMILEFDGTFQKPEAGKLNLINAMLPRVILDKCTTVVEAVDEIKKYTVQTMFAAPNAFGACTDMHYVIADATGDRVVVEWVNNEIRVMRPGDADLPDQKGYALATNFYLSSTNLPEAFVKERETVKELGFWRYEQMTKKLGAKESFTSEEGMDMLKGIRIMQNDPDALKIFDLLYMYPNVLLYGEDHTHWPEWDQKDKWPWISLWSEVYDTETKSMIYCARENYNEKFTFAIDYK